MTQSIRVGIIGAGWPAHQHAEGFKATGGFSLSAVADLIPGRRQAMMSQFGIPRQSSSAMEMATDPQIDLVSICLPNDLHAPVALAALRAGKHVVCETPPALTASEAKKMQAAAQKYGKILLYANQRRFGAAEQAAQQAIAKQYIGDPYHIRASWMRTRGVPAGTGWFTDRARSGGGALIDLGLSLIDLAWSLLDRPEPQSVFCVTTDRLMNEPSGRRLLAAPHASSVEDRPPDASAPEHAPVESAAFCLVRFANGKSLEISSSWAINQSPKHQGSVCRVHATDGAIDLYTPHGPMLYRKFGPKGDAKQTPLKLPKIVQYAAMMRHLKKCVSGEEQPLCGPAEGVVLMQIIDAAYRSAASAKSVGL